MEMASHHAQRRSEGVRENLRALLRVRDRRPRARIHAEQEMSLMATEKEAFYSEARWTSPVGTGNVERTRRRAVCVWQSASAGAGSGVFSPFYRGGHLQ